MCSPINDVLILGAGAAGLMCAITAGQRGRSVRVLERAERPGKKILISGGGRCNFTNLYAGPDNYLSGEPAFCRSALARYGPQDFIDLVERHGIPYHEKKLGQLFCDGSSREIVGMLAAESEAAGVRIETHAEAGEISRCADGHFIVRVGGGELSGRSLVVAAGGLTWPKLGGSDIALRLARQFGLAIVPPRPGLVPLTFSGDTRRLCEELSGVSLPCRAEACTPGSRPFRENLLFTHRGLSGPAVLQASSYLTGRHDMIDADMVFDLLPDAPDNEPWLTPIRIARSCFLHASITGTKLASIAKRSSICSCSEYSIWLVCLWKTNSPGFTRTSSTCFAASTAIAVP